MTTSAFSPSPNYTISGIGPYDVPFDYETSDEIEVFYTADGGIKVAADPADFSVIPEGPATSGTVFLTASAATLHDGETLTIERSTTVSQDWGGLSSTAEELEAQLDLLARAIQDHRAELDAGLNPKGIFRTNFEELLVDTLLTYTTGELTTVSAGTTVRTVTEGYVYQIAASTASDAHLTTAGGVKLYVIPDTNGYNVRAFGAKGDGVTDDSAAVASAIRAIEGGGSDTLYYPDAGPYIQNDIYPDIDLKRLRVIGNSTILVCTGTSRALRFTPYGTGWTNYPLSAAAPIGALSIEVAGHDFVVSDVIYIQSSTIGETAWNYTKGGAYVVTAVSGDTVHVDRPLRFSFTTSDTVFKNDATSELFMSDITVKRSGDSGAQGPCVAVQYCAQVTLKDCGVGAIGTPSIVDGFAFGLTSNISVSRFKADDCRYPLSFQSGMNARISDISCLNTRHMVDFAQFFEYGFVRRFHAITANGGINTHPAFNIFFEDGETTDFQEVSNHRAVGGAIRNVTMKFGPDAGTNGMYWGISLVETEPLEDPEKFGLTLSVENVSVFDNRAAGGAGITCGYSGAFRNIVYRKPGDTTNKNFLIATTGNGPVVARISNIQVSNTKLAENLYTGGASGWHDPTLTIIQESDPVINAVLNGGVYEARFRNSTDFHYHNGMWKYRGNILAQDTLESLDFLLETSPTLVTFPGRSIRITFYYRCQKNAHTLKVALFSASSNNIQFGAAPLIDHTTDATQALVSIGTPSSDPATRDLTLPLTLTKGNAAWNGWLDYEVEIEYL